MQLPVTFSDLIDEANQLELCQKLIQQLNKDLALANVDLEFDLEVLPTSLKLMLHEMVYKLVQEKFMDYLNLLYIIDVSEDKVKQLDGSDTVIMAEQVAFLILQREWQKVWFRNKYS
ncbi:hypothetical protein BZARG_1200 [Bizionia argentinensis JUB59]|uniref:Uncharacterized protein n=1 Tax=Bizionia argentinensis JUB59 TaxID=1046627 RepID=G2ECT1_9FLAO|nr:hypothetical protein [Bizionia argentinensis]EGV43702.1 hypothetical protein BZARG_1200 [Bizionia argentinensis JUB59]